MTRRRPGRRAPRREERGAAPPPHYGDVERRLAEEVLYLHSLWRAGPPAPAFHPGGGSVATHIRADRRKRRRLERLAEPEDAGPDWPLPPSPPASPSPGSWPDPSTSSPSQQPPPQPPPASLAQRPALRAAEEFFSGHASDSDDEEGSESEDAGDAAEGFFVGLFERDTALRGYYERSYEEGEFLCMGCVGRKVRRGRARRFRDCISLVQHARAATRCGRRRAHQALATTVCRVLGWDIERLPSIVIDPRGTLGQALAAREGESAAAAATAQEAKENVDSREDDDGDAANEGVGSGKNSSSSDEEEDGDSEMNDAPLTDGVAAKEDVDTEKSVPSSNGNDGEVHEQDIGVGPAEKEDTNDTDQLSAKDKPKEISEAVQGEGAIDNIQEHAKSADDMGCTSNVRLENSSSEEGADAENKDKHTNNAGTGDDDISNLENNLMDLSKS